MTTITWGILIYVTLKLDEIRRIMKIIGSVGMFLAIPVWCWAIASPDIVAGYFGMGAGKFLLVFFLGLMSLIIGNLLPNMKQAAMIFFIPWLVKNKDIQSIGANALKIPEKIMALIEGGLETLAEKITGEDGGTK